MSPSQLLVQEVQASLPLEEAMPQLVRPRAGQHPSLVKLVLDSSAAPEVKAGLLLYLDELDLSHEISQSLETPTGSYWHAIMHRREGDFWNSKYWLRRAGPHPFLAALPGFDPARFVDQCESGETPDLVQKQREEWKALMDFVLKAAS